MSDPTEKISIYIKKNKVNVSELSRDTGIAYRVLYDSFLNSARKRKLRADEFLKICKYLQLDMTMFAEDGKAEKTKN